MNYILRGVGVLATVGAVSLFAFSLPHGGEARGDGGENLLPRVTHRAWQQECGSCHLAYPPSLLPRASWREMMGGLDRHFGEDASLDPVTQADILKFLETHAADSGASRVGERVMQRSNGQAPQRITETRWFVRKHDEVAPDVWKRKSVGSPANCAACHRQAEKGLFDDDSVRIPRP